MKAFLTAILITALITAVGCGDTSSQSPTQSQVAKKLPASIRRKLHGKAILVTPKAHELGVATLGMGRSSTTRTLQLDVSGLRPSGGRNYAAWLSADPEQMLWLGSFEVGHTGELRSVVEFPNVLLRNLEHGAFLEIILTSTNRAKLEKALDELPSRNEYSPYTGVPIAHGIVTGPIVGARPNLHSVTR